MTEINSTEECQFYFNKETFELWIENNKNNYDSSYVDTIMGFMILYGMDEENIKQLISPTLFFKIKNEAIRDRSIKSDIKQTNFSVIF